MGVEVSINRETCIGSGNCSNIAPASFDLDDEGIAIVLDPDAEPEEKVVEAGRACPTDSISVTRDGEKLV